MRHAMIIAAAMLAGAATPSFAQSLNLSNTQLNNISIGAGTGGLGHGGFHNSASLGGSRIAANTSVRSTFGANTNTNPAGNNGLGGVANGVAQTTVLDAAGGAVANTSLSGNGTLNASLNPTALTTSGTLSASFNRTANSNALSGMTGYSGAQLTGPGSVSNSVNGSAIAIGAGLSAGAGLTP